MVHTLLIIAFISFCVKDTDCGFLTILAQDLPGLEIQDPITNEWNLISPVKDTFVVNLGDMAARWTNDTYRSTKHRVYNTNDSPRYSVPFFCNCNFDAPVHCILQDIGVGKSFDDNEAEQKAKYEPTTAGAYILERLGLMRLVN